MKTYLTVCSVFLLFAIASTIESYDIENIYNHCIQQGSARVFTDTDAEILETRCQAISGFNPNH